jgi:hypothetical protein
MTDIRHDPPPELRKFQPAHFQFAKSVSIPALRGASWMLKTSFARHCDHFLLFYKDAGFEITASKVVVQAPLREPEIISCINSFREMSEARRLLRVDSQSDSLY